ncbi:MAG: PEGA domain-containing protein, partial [Myxococcales bacterium]|nr:PEGA domain-containing protein [Myxococcales bacterium]
APPASAAAIASATAPVGLFANTAISKSDPPPLPATPARTSFFPPVPGGASDDGGLALAGTVAAVPAPAAAAAAAAAPAAAPAGDVVDQLFATVASEDDAAAGGGDFANAATVAAVPAPAPAAATPASDAEAQSVDALFDDLAQAEVSAPAASPPAATPGSAETSFAGLAESEAPAPLAPAADAAPEDDLFAAVDDEEVDPFADVDQVDALDDDPGGWVDDDDDGDVDMLEMEEFGEADIFGSTSAPPPPEGVGSVAPQLALADEVPVAPAKKRSPVLWIVLLAAGGGAGFFALQQPGGLGALLGGSQAAAPTATPLEPAPAGQPAENAEGAAAEAAGADVAQEGAPGQGTGEEMVIGAEEVAEGDGADEQAPAAGDAPAAQAGGEAAAAAAAANLPPVRVEITSVPRGSEVLLDGKPVGTTPTRLELAVGKEVAVTVRTKGYAALTKKVRPAAPPDPVRFKLDPLPYELVVKTTPRGAEVSVGEVSEVSPAPLKLGHLLGSVHVGVAKEGYRRMTRPVRLEEFSERDGVMRAVVEVRLSPLPGVVKPTKKKKRYY